MSSDSTNGTSGGGESSGQQTKDYVYQPLDRGYQPTTGKLDLSNPPGGGQSQGVGQGQSGGQSQSGGSSGADQSSSASKK
jgi:hypothetical protein